MKVILFFLVLISFYTNGQNGNFESKKDSLVVCSVPTNAEYPGGLTKLNTFIFDNFNIELDSLEATYIPKLFVQFTIYEDGSVQEIKVINNVLPYFENEAIRVFSIMPNWTPAYLDGKPTLSQYTIPINICLR